MIKKIDNILNNNKIERVVILKNGLPEHLINNVTGIMHGLIYLDIFYKLKSVSKDKRIKISNIKNVLFKDDPINTLYIELKGGCKYV